MLKMEEGEWCAHADPAARKIAPSIKIIESLRVKKSPCSRFRRVYHSAEPGQFRGKFRLEREFGIHLEGGSL
jgi:hypothetical protein